jgi:V8-like Glu-specific endopeptidase
MKRIRTLEQTVDDLKTILPARFVENTEKSSIKILRYNAENETLEGCGVGFFINNNMVVSCAHNFPELKDIVNNDIKKIIAKGEIYDGQVIELRLIGFSGANEYDLAIFETEYNNTHHLTIGSPQQHDTRLAITSFSIGLTNAVGRDNVMRQHFMVIQGILIEVTNHHIVYQSNLFSGDSGGAVICASDGRVIGIHTETVNEAHEKIENERITLAELNESINSIVSGLSQGFVGLRLDSDVIGKILNQHP